MRPTTKALLAISLLTLFGASAYQIAAGLPPLKTLATPIKYVRVEGYFQYLSEEEIKSVLLPQISAGYWEADVQAIQQAVSTLPWVEKVSVKRVWPDVIAIQLMEKIPYTRWGSDKLVTETGDIFTPKDLSPFLDMTIIEGPEQQQLNVLETMQGIKTTLADQSMSLTEFKINSRGAWQIKLASGLQIQLGRTEPLKRLQRFLRTLSLLAPEKVAAMAVVDLRYPNGYAVAWKPETPVLEWNLDNSQEELATPKNN
ncbi:cell division protein FtsQ/DivIB [Methylosoma difficile]